MIIIFQPTYRILTALLILLAPVSTYAHSADRGFVLLLPTTYYVVGGTLAVLASIVAISLIGRNYNRAGKPRQFSITLPLQLAGFRDSVSLLSTALLIILVTYGFVGSTDPLDNPLPLTVWTLWWVGFTLLHALVGNLWALLNPWSGLARFIPAMKNGRIRLPEQVGYWPAIIGMLLFAWFELVSIAPSDPPTLAIAVMFYWSVNVAAIALFGLTPWMQRGESFSVFFRFIALLSPFSLLRSRNCNTTVNIGIPGLRLVTHPAVHWSGAVFILITLATVSFDGLNKTFWWLALNDINPLAFSGRSAVIWINSQGLLFAIGSLLSLYSFCIWLGWTLVGKTVPFTLMFGRYALTIIPISLVYHFAHYLTQLLVNGQYAAKIYFLPDLMITTSFLSNHHSVEKLWQLQTGAIVVGHIASVLLLDLTARSLHPIRGDAIRAQLPLSLLMVLYTTFGLWLLSTPAI